MTNTITKEVERSAADLSYGRIVYWFSIAASYLCTIAPILAVAFPERNFLNPYFLFARIWQKMPPQRIWASPEAKAFDAWFWTRNVFYGDGLIMAGVVLGCSCAGFGLLGAAAVFIGKKKEVGWGFASLAMAAAIFLALSGLLV